jgi:hypothetical protein
MTKDIRLTAMGTALVNLLKKNEGICVQITEGNGLRKLIVSRTGSNCIQFDYADNTPVQLGDLIMIARNKDEAEVANLLENGKGVITL